MFIIPTSDHPFYLWQSVVQMHALQDEDARWLFYSDGKPSKILQGILDSKVAKMSVWSDWPRDRKYNAAMKPWLVGKWLNADGYDGDVTVIDPDVIPTGNPLPEAVEGVLLGTNTDSYTGPNWLHSKSSLRALCSLLNVDIEEVRATVGIGAQYTFKGIDGDWWENVARDSIKAYHMLKSIPTENQPWCAEMYVTHLSAVRDGLTPTPSDEMSMVWANGDVEGWTEDGFFHDAGVQNPREGQFCKNLYQSWPKDIPTVDEGVAASFYVEMIKDVENDWPELVSLFDPKDFSIDDLLNDQNERNGV